MTIPPSCLREIRDTGTGAVIEPAPPATAENITKGEEAYKVQPLPVDVITSANAEFQCADLILNQLEPTCAADDLALLTEESEDDRSRFEKDYFWFWWRRQSIRRGPVV